MSPRELTAIYAEALKRRDVRVKQDPGLLADGKIADAIVKRVSVPRKPGTRSRYPGAVTGLIEIANKRLEENQSELKAKTAPCRKGIYPYSKEHPSTKE
jgi:hypothetical protein